MASSLHALPSQSMPSQEFGKELAQAAPHSGVGASRHDDAASFGAWHELDTTPSFSSPRHFADIRVSNGDATVVVQLLASLSAESASPGKTATSMEKPKEQQSSAGHGDEAHMHTSDTSCRTPRPSIESRELDLLEQFLSSKKISSSPDWERNGCSADFLRVPYFTDCAGETESIVKGGLSSEQLSVSAAARRALSVDTDSVDQYRESHDFQRPYCPDILGMPRGLRGRGTSLRRAWR